MQKKILQTFIFIIYYTFFDGWVNFPFTTGEEKCDY